MTEETQAVLVDEEISSQEAVEQQQENESPGILRTANDGCFEVYQGPWGKYIRPCFDPKANVEITKEHLNHFELNEDIHRIPADLWTRWVNLCFHFVDKVTSSVEVSIRILRSEDDASKYRIVVPRQKVSGATVRVDSFEESIDIETGEELTSYPPQGWIPVGSSHSHNTMAAFFSGTDDKYELGDPGIHLVVGGIKVQERRYSIAASVVGAGRRFELEYSHLVDTTPIENVDFHPKVLEYVDYQSPTYTYTSSALSRTNAKSEWEGYNKWLQRNSKYSNANYSNTDINDPFSYSEYFQSYGGGVYSSTNKDVRLWEIEDLINDYINQNQDQVEKLIDLENRLKDFLPDIEAGIQLNFEALNL